MLRFLQTASIRRLTLSVLGGLVLTAGTLSGQVLAQDSYPRPEAIVDGAGVMTPTHPMDASSFVEKPIPQIEPE